MTEIETEKSPPAALPRTTTHWSLRAIRIKKPEGTPGSSLTAILVGLFVAFGGVLFGYDTGTIGGIIAMPAWLATFCTDSTLTASQSSLIVSILSAGTFFGALTAAPLADYIGRRWALIVTLCVFCFGVILQTAASAIPLFVAGRFFAGFGVGLISAISKCSLSCPLFGKNAD